MGQIYYGSGSRAENSITPPATLTTTETDLVVVKDHKYLDSSQLTVYLAVTLGGVASTTFYYYYSFDEGTTWHPVSLYDTSTGKMTQRAVVIDSGTYAASNISYALDNLGLGTATQFKVTGKSASSTPAFTVVVGVRNN